MSEKIKVLFLVDNFTGGGAQEHAYQLFKNIDKNRFSVTVVTFHKADDYYEKIKQTAVDFVVLSNNSGLYQRFLGLLIFVKIVYSGKFDLVHTFLPGAFLVAVPISWLNRVKVVHSVLSLRSQPPGWYYPLMKFCQFMVNAFVVLEEKELNELGIPPSKITMSEVLLDFQKAYEVSLANQTTAKRNRPDLFVVLSAGRLHPDKGHDFAIRAWCAVIKEFPNAKLWIAGSGSERDRLQELISALDLKASVELLGYVNNLEEIYSKIDLFLRMTTNEGANLTTLLAMAASRPIIAFKTDVPKDYIYHDFTGWLVPIDEAKLALAIIHLLSAPDLRERLGSQAFRSLKTYYDLARVVHFHEDLYTEVCRGSHMRILPTMKEHMWPTYNPFLRKD